MLFTSDNWHLKIVLEILREIIKKLLRYFKVYLSRPGRNTDSCCLAFMALLEHINNTDTATWTEVSVTDQELYAWSMTVCLPGVVKFNKLQEMTIAPREGNTKEHLASQTVSVLISKGSRPGSDVKYYMWRIECMYK